MKTNSAGGLIERYAGWLTTSGVVIACAGLIWNQRLEPPTIAVIAGLVIGILGILHLFTRRLTRMAQLRAIFRFAYGFMATVIFGGIYLLIMLDDPLLAGVGKAIGEDTDCLLDDSCDDIRFPVAVGILPGCDYTPVVNDVDSERVNSEGKDDRTPGTPFGAYCNQIPPQWVLSIGGYVLKCHVDGTCNQPPPAASTDRKQLELVQDSKLAAFRQAQNDLNSARDRVNADETALGEATSTAEREYFENSLADSRSALRGASARLELAREEFEIARQQFEAAPENSVLANTRASLITGGLVVPLYFVVLATFGAMVSMMRKTPEFQRRVTKTYRIAFEQAEEHERDNDSPPILLVEAREYVVFQMLQVTAAPMIALVAYSYVEPSELATSAVLAFAVGFSAEAFLMAIRKFAESIVDMKIRKYVPRKRKAGAPADRSGPTPSIASLIPPRGEISTGGQVMQVGDKVELRKPLAHLRPGARGTIIAIDDNNFITVRSSHDEEGRESDFILPPQTSDFFKLEGTEGPATEEPQG